MTRERFSRTISGWPHCRLAAFVLIGALILTWGAWRPTGALSEEKPDAKESKAPTAKVTAAKKWTVLFKMPPQPPAIPKPLGDDSLVTSYDGLAITGVDPKHPYLLGDFRSSGDWGVGKFGLQPLDAKNSALLVARGESFDLEGELSAEGLGGWFLVVGLKDGHGYVLYNVKFKESGSPWMVAELRDGKCVAATQVEVARHNWTGYQPFRLSVIGKKLNLIAGRETILKDLEMANYHEGDVVVGTYDTKYGPKPLKVRSLRVRSR